ncbi:MAG: aspartate kinase [Candidatus Thermoplasmatota archaeon]
MKVLKFGGACLKDSNSFLRVADLIENEQAPKAVVVSAVNGVTDLLRKYLESEKVSSSRIESLVHNIEKRHFEIANSAIKERDILAKTLKIIRANARKLSRLLYGVAYTGGLTPRTEDLILSFGERLSAPILEGVLRARNIKAKALNAEKIGLVTDSNFGDATALLEECERNFKKTLLPLVKRNFIPIITGFLGRTKDWKTTTLGRGGSDYSAAVVAYGLNAEVLELWKDVEGFMSCDPKIVNHAFRLRKLSYNEAAELAYFGAKLLHPRTIEPVSKKNILVVIKNIYHPEMGSCITKTGYKKKMIIKSIAFMRNLAMLKVYGSGAGYKKGLISEITSQLSREGINICSCTTSQTCLGVIVESKDLNKGLQALESIKGGFIEKVEKIENLALVCVVGEGLSYTKGLAARVFTALAKANVNIELISAGASEVACHFVIKQNDLERAVNEVHKAFFG